MADPDWLATGLLTVRSESSASRAGWHPSLVEKENKGGAGPGSDLIVARVGKQKDFLPCAVSGYSDQ